MAAAHSLAPYRTSTILISQTDQALGSLMMAVVGVGECWSVWPWDRWEGAMVTPNKNVPMIIITQRAREVEISIISTFSIYKVHFDNLLVLIDFVYIFMNSAFD